MKDYPIIQVDAFADAPFSGNPAAVMPLESWPDDQLLQNMAMENALSETAFTVPIEGAEDADFELRWFTPQVEVVLCGHATLAAAHVLMDRDHIAFRTRRAGRLSVRRDGAGYEMSLPAWKPEPKPLDAINEALGCQAVENLWHPHRYGLVVLASEAELRALRPDFRALAAQGDVLTIVTAPGTDTDIVSRVFATGAGIDEDPVTGSAHAVLVPYWAERLGRDRLSAFQASRRGGRLTGQLAGDRVLLGGRCVTVMQGVMRV